MEALGTWSWTNRWIRRVQGWALMQVLKMSQECYEPCLFFLCFSHIAFPFPYCHFSYVFLYYHKSCTSIFDPLLCIDSFSFIFRFTFWLRAVHGSHQGSSSSCARWHDHGIMRRHCIRHCIAVHLFGNVWASRLIYKDTMYRSKTPELFWSNTSIVDHLFLWTYLSSVNILLLTETICVVE